MMRLQVPDSGAIYWDFARAFDTLRLNGQLFLIRLLLLRIAAFITARFPWMGRIIFNVYRRFVARFTIGALVVLIDDDNCVLIAEHRFHPEYPWGLPGGVVEATENPNEAARREVYEELGLDVLVHQPVVIEKSDLYPQHLTIVFIGELKVPFDSSQVQLSYELKQYQWVSIDALPADMHPFQQNSVHDAYKLMKLKALDTLHIQE